MQQLGRLKPGDSYGNGKYRVWKRTEFSITVIRLSDNIPIVFYEGSVNWNWLVKKD